MSFDRCPHLVDCNVLEEGNHNLYCYNFHGTTSTKFGKIGCEPKKKGKRGNFFLCLTTKFANFALRQSTYNLVEYHLTKSTVWYICVDSMKTYEDITNILENIKNSHDNVGSEREFWKLTKGFDGTWWIQIQLDPSTLLF
jgi:hypothetical protein